MHAHQLPLTRELAPKATEREKKHGISYYFGENTTFSTLSPSVKTFGFATSGCGARNFLLAFAHKISTAAPPFCSLHPPQAALANVPLTEGGRSAALSLKRCFFRHAQVRLFGVAPQVFYDFACGPCIGIKLKPRRYYRQNRPAGRKSRSAHGSLHNFYLYIFRSFGYTVFI